VALIVKLLSLWSKTDGPFRVTAVVFAQRGPDHEYFSFFDF
jgi:hypothetical protein